MVVVAGIDAGTKSYDFVILKNGEFEVESFDSLKVKEDPKEFFEVIENSEATVYAGLSGYGMPIKRFCELSEFDLLLMTLNLESEKSLGLRNILDKLRHRMDFYTIPGVIHLPTLPEWRKFNRIDLGTSDKVCSAVLAVTSFAEEMSLEKQNFILAEIGYGFTSLLAIKNGKIVDALGGTSGFIGFSSLGAMDAEVAYLLGSFPKSLIFSGGIKDFTKDEKLAIQILSEFVLKGFRALEVSIGKAEFCVLSGRFAREVEKNLSDLCETRVLKGFCDGKQSAQGAAIVANAIAKGNFRWIVEHMEIFNAKGSVLDYLYEPIRRRVLERLNLYLR
ncbi:MAG: DUF1464 family protein [Archaeoglobaceae archaeon]